MKQKEARLHMQFVVNQTVPLEGADPVTYLDFKDKHSEDKFNEFMGRLIKDQVVDVFYDANKDDGTLAQLAKIHASIKQLALDTGYTFDDMKLEIKRLSGLCIKKEIGGDMFMVCKSFGKCSKEELSLVIEAIVQLGDHLGSNLR